MAAVHYAEHNSFGAMSKGHCGCAEGTLGCDPPDEPLRAIASWTVIHFAHPVNGTIAMRCQAEASLSHDLIPIVGASALLSTIGLARPIRKDPYVGLIHCGHWILQASLNQAGSGAAIESSTSRTRLRRQQSRAEPAAVPIHSRCRGRSLSPCLGSLLWHSWGSLSTRSV